VAAAIAAVAAVGCVDGFRGSNLQLDLSPGTPVQARVVGAPAAGELPANTHFTIYEVEGDPAQGQMVELARFEVHRIIDPTSPCFIDVGAPHPGLHVTMYAAKIAEDVGIPDLANPPPTATEPQKIQVATAMQRIANVAALGSDAGIRVVTSASAASYAGYYPIAASCVGPADQLPPATCTDEASNRNRLRLCQAVWKAEPDLFEGTDRVLTAPLGGVTRGMVDGLDPINQGPVGGAQFFVDDPLDHAGGYAIYTQTDGIDGPGTQLFFGRPTAPTRGVSHVHLVNPGNPALTAEMAVFADLGQDDVSF
jgi:hypothetical protein